MSKLADLNGSDVKQNRTGVTLFLSYCFSRLWIAFVYLQILWFMNISSTGQTLIDEHSVKQSVMKISMTLQGGIKTVIGITVQRQCWQKWRNILNSYDLILIKIHFTCSIIQNIKKILARRQYSYMFSATINSRWIMSEVQPISNDLLHLSSSIEEADILSQVHLLLKLNGETFIFCWPHLI